jgi:transmembrane sensor
MSVQNEIDRLLARRAAEWFEVYRTGQKDQYPAFQAWLTESPRHMAEFLEIARRYPAIRDALRSGAFDHEALLRKLAPNVTALHPPAPSRAQESPRLRAAWWWAAGLAATVVIGAFLFWARPDTAAAWQPFETQVGEQRVIQLLDGSVLTLNAQSFVSVRLRATERDVRLLRGEAMFKVAHDKARPFLVHTQGATVRAVGTQFNVYARPDGSTTVAVLEGRVEVSAAAVVKPEVGSAPKIASPAKLMRTALDAGEAASVASSGTIHRDEHPDIGSAVAWRQRRLVFDRTPLEEIVPEFNRYNRTLQMRIENVEPGAYHFTGSFDADDPQSLALLLSKEPELVVEQREGEILIKGRAPPR